MGDGRDAVYHADTPVDPRYRMLRNQRLPEMLQQWSINLSLLAVDLLERILLERILRCQPADRPSVAEIAQHPWLHSD